MSDHKPPPAKVPDGVTPYVTTRQMQPNEKGFGNGIFSFFYDFDTAYKHMGVALGDQDGDADLDAFTTGWDNTYNKVWLNDGTGIFSEAQSIPNANTISVQLGTRIAMAIWTLTCRI